MSGKIPLHIKLHVLFVFSLFLFGICVLSFDSACVVTPSEKIVEITASHVSLFLQSQMMHLKRTVAAVLRRMSWESSGTQIVSEGREGGL